MVYCQQCGAANDIMSRQCHRCGCVLTSEAEAVSAAASNAAAPRAASGFAPPQPSLDIGQGLELPDWLKRAAAETPPEPAADRPISSQMPPAGFHVAPSTTTGLAEPEESNQPPRPLPPVPNAGLPSAMPEWLRTQTGSAEPDARPIDPTDTTSFISENDLPEWIRQIAAADAAKEEERKRLAAEAAQNEGAAKRPVLPGESAAPAVPATNPWLARRDVASAEQAWSAATASVAAPAPASAPAPETAAAPSEPAPLQTDSIPEAAPASKRGFKLSLPAIPKPTSAGGETDQQSKLRTILVAAILVLLLVLLAGMLL